ncbi:recombinase family protein [Clostridium aestuarii]|uniref:Recombinase family protein n=1 Tax=Clostridium aestuarii TaxID=338193 RepID=A0ABT4CYD2_9CLOT|nr:recombinase family protein [Clostridium aestuarii]MCY6482813.1 recombinase family protein [Clostridium aestuarii]
MKNDTEVYEYNPNHYCAIYGRRSTKNNKDNIQNQLQTCRDKASELNLLISQEYLDYESATKYEPFHRPGFKKLIYDLKHNKFKSIIVFKRDRLARKTVHFKEIKYLCKQNNVNIIYAANDEFALDDNSEISSLIENILVSFAELEPANIALRTKDGLDRKRASHNYSISAKVPKGYIKLGKSKNAELIHDPKLAPIITYLFKRFSDSPLTRNSLKEIVNDVNSKYKLKFTISILERIIKSPIYTGWYTKTPKTPIEKLLIANKDNSFSIDKSQLIPANNITPIIKDFDVWEKIVTKYFHVNGFSNINSMDSSKCMFSSLIYCKRCNSKVYLIDNYFECVNHCFRTKKETLLNKLLSDVIDDLFTNKKIINYYNYKMEEIQSQTSTIEKQLKSLNTQQDKLMLKMIKYKTITNTTFDDLSIEEKTLKDKYDKLKGKISEYIYYKENLHEKIVFQQKNLLIQHFILNENIANDFLKNIIKRVKVYVSYPKYSSQIQYKSSSIPPSIR